MKATTICPKCGKLIETDCEGCIYAGTALHTCNEGQEPDVIEVKWKVFPENEDELRRIEEDESDFA